MHKIACSKIAEKKVQNMARGSCGRRKTGGLCPLKREKDRGPRLPDLTSRGSNTPSVPKGTVADMRSMGGRWVGMGGEYLGQYVRHGRV